MVTRPAKPDSDEPGASHGGLTDIDTGALPPPSGTLPTARRGTTVFAVDCDRTLTGPDLVPDARALDAIQQLRDAGVRCILVTGRTKADLGRHARIPSSFDAYVLEGGALWGPWDDLWVAGTANIVLDAAARVQADGIDVEVGAASFSCRRGDLGRVRELARSCSIQPNVDRVDVLPPACDKGTGLDAALARLGIGSARVIAIGDGENDLPLFNRASVSLAVGNAHAALKEAADEALHAEGPRALVEAAHRLAHGEWAFQPPKG